MSAVPLDPTTSPGYRSIATEGASAAIQSASVPPQTLTIAEATLPPWMSAVVERLNDLLGLEADWDTYGAAPVLIEHALAAFGLLSSLMPADAAPPWIVPTTSRGIQFEWHLDPVEVEARVDDDGAHLFVADPDGEDEGDPAARPDLVMRAVRALAETAAAAV
jgi:hypothetical protein